MFLIADLDKYMLPCLNKKLFGLECMGCGFQRSFVLLLNGEFVDAFKMYPAIYTLIALVLLIGVNMLKPSKIIYNSLLALGIINLLIIIGNFFMKTFSIF